MERIYIDSSVYIKLFKREKGTNTAKRLFSLVKSPISKTRLFLSYWTIAESISVIDCWSNQRHEKNKGRTKITKLRRDIIIATIFQGVVTYSDSKITLARISHNMIEDSIKHIYAYNISADDSLHLHVAYKTDCKWLVTADKRLKRQADNKVELNGLRIIDIENKQEMDELFKHIAI